MNEYGEFVNQLQVKIKTFLSSPNENWQKEALRFVDGYAADELRRLINIEKRREYGAFFTGSDLARQILLAFKPKFDNKSIIYDPACGAGNLLIAVSNYLHEQGIENRLDKLIYGTDIHKEFIEAARLRMSMNLLLKQTKPLVATNFSSGIIKADGLLKNDFYEKATHIFVNPPFHLADSNGELDWAAGKVSSAAIFIDKIIQNISEDSSVLAILPDVLRSGSRYEKWRTMVKKTCEVEKIKLLGQFDKYADVDVYALQLRKRKTNASVPKTVEPKKSIKRNPTNVIEKLFDVCVGPVVDNRDPREGKSLSYIVSKGLEGWGVERKIFLKRKYSGRSFKSPFVVIKRTSRRGDSYRAIATIINTPNPVYIDNHLIVLEPKSKKVSDCHKALSILKDKRTDNWIDKKIRCRHLTVKVVTKIPLWQ